MTPILHVQNLTFSYPAAARHVLHEISFSIAKDESVGLIGPNGAGKSTLLLHLVGVLAGSGTIQVGSVPIQPGNLSKIRKQVGMVLSDPDDQLFMSTVYDDIAFGPRNLGCSEDDIPELVKTALAKVDLAGFEQRPPHLLSSGEKRRVSIATVLAMNPSLLILDEPNNDLDPRGRRELIHLLNSFSHGKLIASHDLDLIGQTCTRCLVLHNGTLVEDRPTPEVLADKTFLEAHGLR